MEQAADDTWFDGEAELARDTAARLLVLTGVLGLLALLSLATALLAGSAQDRVCGTVDAATSSATYERCQRDRQLKSDLVATTAASVLPASISGLLLTLTAAAAGLLWMVPDLSRQPPPRVTRTLTWAGRASAGAALIATLWLLVQGIAVGWDVAGFVRSASG